MATSRRSFSIKIGLNLTGSIRTFDKLGRGYGLDWYSQIQGDNILEDNGTGGNIVNNVDLR